MTTHHTLGGHFVARPHETLAELRRTCPVGRVDIGSGTAWVVTSAAGVRAGLTDQRLSLRRQKAKRRAVDISLVNVEAPEHTRIRNLATPLLTPARVAPYRPVMQRIADDLLGGVTGEFDMMASFAKPYPFLTLCEMFGIPPADRTMLRGWVDLFLGSRNSDPDVQREIDRFDAYVRDLVVSRHTHPGDDLVSGIVGGWRSDSEVTLDEVISLCAMLFLAGVDSTTQMIGLCVRALTRDPALYRQLAADPDLIPGVVEEMLRWDTPAAFATARRATEDIEIAGVTIPRGSQVLLSLAGANRDPAAFAEPDRIDPRRHDARRHLTFGGGPHYCPGAAVARLELAVALGALVRFLPTLTLVGRDDDISWTGGPGHRRIVALPVRGST